MVKSILSSIFLVWKSFQHFLTRIYDITEIFQVLSEQPLKN